MKRIMLIIALALVFSTTAMAQKERCDGKQMTPEKMEAIFNAKMQKFQKRLMLSPEQTEKFIPIYKEYLGEIMALPRLKRSAKGETFETSEQAYAFVKSGLERKRVILTLQERYVEKLKNVLNPQQLIQVLRVEHDIQKQIMNERHKRRDSSKTGKHKCDSPEGKKK